MESINVIQEIDINSAFRAVNLIENFLPNLYNDSMMILTQPQKDAIDSIQYGFPLSQYNFDEILEPPRGVVMVWPRQTGKTTACAYAASALLVIIPNCSIGIIAATEKQSKKLFDKIKKILRKSVFGEYIIKKTMRIDYLELTNGSFVECWPCTTGIEGSTYSYLFIDEAAIMDEEIIFKSALPTVTHGKRWIMLSTPKGPKGKFIDYYFEGLDSRPIICKKCKTKFSQADFNVDRFPIGTIPIDQMHDCPNCGAHDYKYGVGKFMVPWVDPWNDGVRSKKLVKKLLDDSGWSPIARQEYLGEVVSDASTVFLSEWINRAENPRLHMSFEAKQNIVYHIGIDYGRKHDASCFYVTTKIEKTGKIRLVYAKSVAGEWDHQRTYKYIRKELMKIIKNFNPVTAAPDATGLGDPLVEEFEEDLKKVNVQTTILNYPHGKGVIFSRSSKPKIIGNLIKMFSQGMIELPSRTNPEIKGLIEELLRYECDMHPGSDYIKYGTQSFHDDRVIALALSVWCHKFRPSMIGQVEITPVMWDATEGYYYE
ncbi:MAG: terminase large subunit domain-containing protein [Promethearchaeota archaeon]